MSDIVAVVCILESSLAFASEWPQILGEYLVPLLHRLETHAPSALRMAFVTYATADTRPTPILSKNFFLLPPTALMNVMQEQPHECGIGQTTSGAGQGMAALEGIVTAMEMIEMYKACMETPNKANSQTFTGHLIHLACTSPDSAERPLWNSLPAYDSISWDTLPAELKERKINYSNILLKQIPRLSKLQASAAIGSTQNPWFTVRSPHVVLLTGFPQPQTPQPQKGTKRPSNNGQTPDQTEKVKRAKTSPKKSPATPAAPATPATTHATPSAVPSSSSPPGPAPATMSAPGPVSAPVLVPAEPPPAPSVPAPGGPGPANANKNMPDANARPADSLAEKMRIAEQVLRTQAMRAQELERAGRLAEAADAKKNLHAGILKFKQLQQIAQAQAQNKQAQAGGQVPAQAESSAAQPAPGPTSQHPSQPPAAGGPSTATDLAANLEPGAGPGRPTPVLPPAVLPGQQGAGGKGTPQQPIDPNIAAQMTKLIEQTSKHPPSSIQPSVPTPASPEKQQAAMSGSGRWQGTLTWRGFDSETHVQKNLHTQVIMQHGKGEIMRAELWPSSLSLAPSQHAAVPMAVLFQWLQRQQCLFLPIQAHPQAPDSKTNEEHFRALNRLLTEKNLYALASWPPNQPENRLLIFPHSGLSAAYFPGPGGIPELPKVTDLPSNPNPAGSQIPTQNQSQSQNPNPAITPQQQQILAVFQSMTLEQQETFRRLPQDKKPFILKTLLARASHMRDHQQQQQQQQHMQAPVANPQQQPQLQPQPHGMNPWGQSGPPNVSAILSQIAGGNQAGAAQQQQHQPGMGGGPGQNPMANLMMNMDSMGGMGAGPSNMGNMGNMSNLTMNFGMVMPRPGQGGPPGMHRRTPSGNLQGVSYEMLQSFMQRSQEGGAGGGAGPSGSMG